MHKKKALSLVCPPLDLFPRRNKIYTHKKKYRSKRISKAFYSPQSVTAQCLSTHKQNFFNKNWKKTQVQTKLQGTLIPSQLPLSLSTHQKVYTKKQIQV